MTAKPIYMDYSATTPCDPRVIACMVPYFGEQFGNAASKSHGYGWEAESAVEQAREQVAALVGAEPVEILWTSGATESNNLAIKGTAEMFRPKGNHIISCATEHPAVLDPIARLLHEGFEVTWLPVDACGRIDLEELRAAITEKTLLISLMAANNETGTLHPVAEIGSIAKERGVLFHTDATQGAGRIDLDVSAQQVDLMSLSSHKFYGPKGMGCLYVRRRNPRVRLAPQMDGGGHERGMRSGTLNVPGIVGMGEAARILARARAEEIPALANLRDRLETGILEQVPDAVVNGDRHNRLPHVTNIGFPGVKGDGLLTGLRDLAVSSGSACTSATLEPSHVLKAMGLPDDLSRGSIRFSLGRMSTPGEVDRAVKMVGTEVDCQRGNAGIPSRTGSDTVNQGTAERP